MNTYANLIPYLRVILFVVFFSFIGITLTFKNKSFTDWFEYKAQSHGTHRITGHKFNRVMFFLEGVFCLLMALFALTSVILSLLGIINVEFG